MAKAKTRYVCQECGRTVPKALGRCPQCGAWDSMVEEIVVDESKSALSQVLPGLGGFSTPKRLNEIDGDSEERISVPIEEFSRVLGGGVVPGSIVLIGGDPGIGKSTLMLQMTMQMASGNTVLYVPVRIRAPDQMRALRLLRGEQDQSGELPDALYLVTETNLDMILQHVQAINPACWWSIPFRRSTGRTWNRVPDRFRRCGKAHPNCASWPRPPASQFS